MRQSGSSTIREQVERWFTEPERRRLEFEAEHARSAESLMEVRRKEIAEKERQRKQREQMRREGKIVIDPITGQVIED